MAATTKQTLSKFDSFYFTAKYDKESEFYYITSNLTNSRVAKFDHLANEIRFTDASHSFVFTHITDLTELVRRIGFYFHS
jgi:hypothetical protein